MFSEDRQRSPRTLIHVTYDRYGFVGGFVGAGLRYAEIRNVVDRTWKMLLFLAHLINRMSRIESCVKSNPGPKMLDQRC
jgi:hypothetical protein